MSRTLKFYEVVHLAEAISIAITLAIEFVAGDENESVKSRSTGASRHGNTIFYVTQ